MTEEIIQLLRDQYGIEAKAADSFRGDLNLDSLEMTELVLELENKFGVSIADDDLPKLRTIADAALYIEHSRSHAR